MEKETKKRDNKDCQISVNIGSWLHENHDGLGPRIWKACCDSCGKGTDEARNAYDKIVKDIIEVLSNCE